MRLQGFFGRLGFGWAGLGLCFSFEIFAVILEVFAVFLSRLRFFCVGIRILGSWRGRLPLAKILWQVSVGSGLGLGLPFFVRDLCRDS